MRTQHFQNDRITFLVTKKNFVRTPHFRNHSPPTRPSCKALLHGPLTRPSCKALLHGPLTRPSCKALLHGPLSRPSCKALLHIPRETQSGINLGPDDQKYRQQHSVEMMRFFIVDMKNIGGYSGKTVRNLSSSI